MHTRLFPVGPVARFSVYYLFTGYNCCVSTGNCLGNAGETHVCKPCPIKKQIPTSASWVLGFSALALSIKLLLQAGSVIPALSNLAFGFRSIVIGYLHLVLLAVITLFILGYMFSMKQLQITKSALAALWIFTAGIFLNELLLMIQGVSAMYYINIPHMNELLLVAALVLFTGLLLLNVSQLKKADKSYSS